MGEVYSHLSEEERQATFVIMFEREILVRLS